MTSEEIRVACANPVLSSTTIYLSLSLTDKAKARRGGGKVSVV